MNRRSIINCFVIFSLSTFLVRNGSSYLIPLEKMLRRVPRLFHLQKNLFEDQIDKGRLNSLVFGPLRRSLQTLNEQEVTIDNKIQ